MSNATDSMERLLAIMAQLRDPKRGCPWDVKQTFETIVPHTIEEAYEVADAIFSGNRDDIKDECGDLLFQVVFYAQLGKEEKAFDFHDIANGLSDKLERRHPHVFANQNISSDEALSVQWEQIKADEKRERAAKDLPSNQVYSILDDIPNGLPALKLATKIQKKCAKVGFDWPDAAPVFDKVYEEVDELKAECSRTDIDSPAIEEELGDTLFALVNLARHVQVDPDTALRKASYKFAKRFKTVERLAQQNQQTPTNMTLDELEALWIQAKELEKTKKIS